MNRRRWSAAVCVLMMMIVSGCSREQRRPTTIDPASTRLEIVDGPEGCRFVAAVEFERIGSMPTEVVRTERDLAGDYTVPLKPVKLISGQWDMHKPVAVEGSLYLAALPNPRLIGLIVKDAQGRTRWFTEFIMKDGKLFEGGTSELAGPESEAPQIVERALHQAQISN